MEDAQIKKRKWIFIVIIVLLSLGIILLLIANGSQTKKSVEKINDLKTEIQENEEKIDNLEEKVDEAQPWFDLSEKERKRKVKEEEEKERQEKEAEEKEKKEKEKKQEKKEKEEKKKKEEKEKQGYETGITYEELARTPEEYEAEKVKLHGKVVQVMEGDSTVQLRIAVDDNYDHMLFAEYDSSITESRVLEDDMITIMGVSEGLLTYESTMGGDITIPAVYVDKIEQ